MTKKIGHTLSDRLKDVQRQYAEMDKTLAALHTAQRQIAAAVARIEALTAALDARDQKMIAIEAR